jgi:hypothetical protein
MFLKEFAMYRKSKLAGIAAAAAMSGLMGGAGAMLMTGCSSTGSTAAAPASTHACKGQNACKGLGGCKTAANECKGKNACKGQGGCKSQ